MRKFKALRDKVIVKVFQEEMSKGGIVMVATEQMEREEGIIMDLGNAVFYDTCEEALKIGDRVAFPRYSGKLLDTSKDGYQIRVMRDIDLLCMISEESEDELLLEAN